MTGPEQAPPVLSGDGLVLRPWTADDVPRMVELFDDAQVDAWTPLASPFDLAAARQSLETTQRRLALGEGEKWAVTLDGGQPFGEVLLMFPAGGGPSAELGYALGVAGRGRGLITRAVRLVMDHAVRVHHRRRFELRIAVGNAASEAVALRCGFVLADADHELHENKGRVVELRVWELAV